MARPSALGLLAATALCALACSEDPSAALAPGDGSADAGDVDGAAGNDGSTDTGIDAGPQGDAAPVGDATINDQCDPLTQTGCNAGDKCVVEPPQGGPFGTRCLPAGVTHGLGESCMGADCGGGLACIRVASSTVARCVQICDRMTGAGCAAIPGEWECRTQIRNSNWGACSEIPPLCDPYTQDPCTPTQACHTFRHFDLTYDFRCAPAGPRGDGQTCGTGSVNDRCMRGLVCVNNPAINEASCRIFCDDNTDCPNMRQCNGMLSQPLASYCGP